MTSDARATANSVEIRSFREDDARAVASLLRAITPDYLISPELVIHWLAAAPKRASARQWVAVDGGHVVGWGYGELKWSAVDPGIGALWAAVRTDARRRGVGAALYDVAEAHLRENGVWKLESWLGDDAGRRFAERRGFEQTRVERSSQLDVRRADLSELPALEAEKTAAGFRLAPLRDLLADRATVHSLYSDVHKDMPGDDERADLDFDEWERETMQNPLLDLDGSVNVLDGDRPVAFAWLLVDYEGRQAEHELTGTLREYRGRGLARLAKLAAIRWCVDNRIDTLLTGNDAENAPMLAINNRLGYVPTIERAEVAKTL